MTSTTLLVIVLLCVAAGTIAYSFLKMAEEAKQALDEAGDMYHVCRAEDDSLVAMFDTDWQAEAYLDEHYTEDLYISSPEERFEAALKKIRHSRAAC